MAGDISNAVAAGYGLMVMHAMDIYRVNPANLTPALPPILIAAGWQCLGYIIGNDHLPVKNGPIQIGGPVCYGYVVRLNNEVVAVFRGTDRFVEWVEDAEFLPTLYRPIVPNPLSPLDAKVESGFWSIYASMVLKSSRGDPDRPLYQAIEAEAAGGRSVTVTGHSLGAPLGTYLALELAQRQLGNQVSGCFFASPHPGNSTFATYFDKTVKNYRVFNYILDVVPRVPLGPDYTHLPQRTVLRPATSEASIELDVGCNHHVICYSAMLDYELTEPFKTNPPPGEESSATCVLGPEIGRPSLAKLLLTGVGDVVQV
ncbi:lipase family protein [Acidisphaera sp. L21]|uniref:lipase family protein n=1 Tax=Acidisphaera sp. L21 TaxID=1641851 RepID=UPI00131D7781|nr:lipase family protein [Acidisphaera sp. L21]